MTPYTIVQNKNIAVFCPILLSMHEQLLKIIISYDRPFLNIIIYMLNFSRASKAFPNQQSLKDSGCGPCFTEVNWHLQSTLTKIIFNLFICDQHLMDCKQSLISAINKWASQMPVNLWDLEDTSSLTYKACNSPAVLIFLWFFVEN